VGTSYCVRRSRRSRLVPSPQSPVRIDDAGCAAAPDGKKSFPFGETPKGLLIFTPDGRFSQIHVASDVPKLASGNRLTGSAEEYATIMRRSLAVFASYAVDEDKKTVTFKIVSSTFPNREGGRRPAPSTSSRRMNSSTSNPNVAGGRRSASNLDRRVK
jgi:hypothetical protein